MINIALDIHGIPIEANDKARIVGDLTKTDQYFTATKEMHHLKTKDRTFRVEQVYIGRVKFLGYTWSSRDLEIVDPDPEKGSRIHF